MIKITENILEDTEEIVIPHFRKIPTYGSQIFRCDKCLHERIYGCAGIMPDNRSVILICEGNCNTNTMHTFMRVHLGRPERNWIP